MTDDQDFDGTLFPEDPAAPETIGRDGYVERVDPRSVSGWCCDRSAPDRSLPVELVGANGARKIAIADIYRRDVQEAGFGNGRHGFDFDLSGMDLGVDQFVVRFADSRISLTARPLSLSLGFALCDTVLPGAYVVALRAAAEEGLIALGHDPSSPKPLRFGHSVEPAS